jgi:hypothetical protein
LVLDPPRQLCIGSWVVPVDPAAEDGNGDPVGLERSSMRFPIDAARESADDDEAGSGELAAEHACDMSAVWRARTGADDGHSAAGKQFRIAPAAEIQLRRWIEDRTQPRWEVGVAAAEPDHVASSRGER